MPSQLAQISAVRLFEHVQRIAAFGPREDASIADNLAADYIAGRFESLGLQVQRQMIPAWVIEPIQQSLRVTSPVEMQLDCHHGTLTGVTTLKGVKGELVFVGKGFEADFEGKDLQGKLAIAWEEKYWEGGDQPRATLSRAAALGGIGLLFTMKRRDRLLTCWGLGNTPATIPFLSISYPDCLALRDLMAKGPVEVEMKVLGEPRRSESANIWAIVPGTELPEEMIGVGSCHHDTVPLCPGANDNASGQAVMLELAHFFRHNPQKRSVMFFTNGGEETGLWGARAFVDTHLDWLSKSLKAMLMLDQAGGPDPMVFTGGTPWLEDMLLEEARKLG
ncbi:MAG: M28 family peptidase, partial [Dehalococcoidales bacterium]|nr:M28 family peptidase [Dehalococcoidales bacterium]